MNKLLIDLQERRMLTATNILDTAVYRGPHLHSRTPMIRLKVDLGEWEYHPTNMIAGFEEQLFSSLPGLLEHGCSYGVHGGFRKRVHEGTWLGHVAEHIALELQHMAGAEVSRGKTRSVADTPGVYNVMFAYEEEQVGLLAGRFAFELILSLLPIELRQFNGLDQIATSPLEVFSLDEAAAHLKQLRGEVALGPTTAALVREARRRGIPCLRLDDTSLVQLGYGRHLRRIRAACTDVTSEIGAEIASDKELTSRLLRRVGIPVPASELVRSDDEAVQAAFRLGLPVVIKPLDGNHGRGVNIDLNSEAEVRWGFEQAQQHSPAVIVEQQFRGKDHRVLVVAGRVIAVAKRVPAGVTGNGTHTIRQLIDKENLESTRGEGHAATLTRIEIDECLTHYIGKQGLTLDSTPAANHFVQLRPTANLSTGGTAVDVTDEIHADNRLIAERAANIVGLDVAGIDLVVPDIRRSVFETGGGIIEVNAGPGLRMHLKPSGGTPRNVAGPIIDMLFPPAALARIPIFALTGTNGKTTTAKMLARILCRIHANVALTATTGIYINQRRVVAGDCTGPASARAVLCDRTVDAAVLETARGGILREGLGFDECDVGCVLNIAEDHLGLKEIMTLDDLAAVKSVVVESVSKGGWSILNADDQLTFEMRHAARGKLCFFTMKPRSAWPEFLEQHLVSGGRVVAASHNESDVKIAIHDGLLTRAVSRLAIYQQRSAGWQASTSPMRSPPSAWLIAVASTFPISAMP
jgi:cyanophycin synthetase